MEYVEIARFESRLHVVKPEAEIEAEADSDGSPRSPADEPVPT